jgi:hypothetical protein
MQFAVAEFARQGNRLDRDQTIDGHVPTEIDDPHGAATDLALEPVAAELTHGGCIEVCGVAAGASNRRELRCGCGRGRRGLGGGGRFRRLAAAGGCTASRGAGRRHPTCCGLGCNAFFVEQSVEPVGDVLVLRVDAHQMAIDRGCLGRSAALLQLGPECVQIAEHRGAWLARLEFGETLLEIVEQLGGIPAGHDLVAGRGRNQAGRLEPAPQRDAGSDHDQQQPPGSQYHAAPVPFTRSTRVKARKAKPTNAAISPIFLMQ